MPNPSNGRIDRVFQGYDTPATELIHAIALSLMDHYEDSDVRLEHVEVQPADLDNSRVQVRSLELEGRKFLVRVEELP